MTVNQAKYAAPSLEEVQYSALFENNLDGVLLTLPDGSIEDANPAACQLFGWSREEIIRLDRNSIFDSTDPRLHDFIAFHEQNGRFSGELTGLRRDGSKFPLSVTCACYKVKEGDFRNCKIVREMTETRQMEASLRFHRKVVENIAQGFSLVRVGDNSIIYVNPSFNRMFGYEQGELIGKNVSILNASGEKTSLQVSREINEILTEKGSWRGEVKNIRKDGEEFWCSASVTSMSHPLFGPVWISVHVDITENKRAELARKANESMLLELNSTKDKFFSIIAHDLKNPFNAIVGFSELLKDQIEHKDYDGVEEYAVIIQRSARSAMDLLENLLEWSRLQTGKISFNPEVVDIVAQIEEIAELFKGTAQQKSINITLILPECLYLLIDTSMISSVLRNLLSNAIKFTNLGGRISLEAKQTSKGVVVVVKDNGVGIGNEMIHKLFKIDKTFSTAGTNKEKGSGLGLILVKEFIEKHGGQLFVESEQGVGSTFSFTLPN